MFSRLAGALNRPAQSGCLENETICANLPHYEKSRSGPDDSMHRQVLKTPVPDSHFPEEPHFWSYLHRGQNALLNIGSRKTYSSPNTFYCNNTHVYPDVTTGKLILREATSTYTFAAPNTQAANSVGQTMTDLVNALTQSLVRQGYQKQ